MDREENRVVYKSKCCTEYKEGTDNEVQLKVEHQEILFKNNFHLNVFTTTQLTGFNFKPVCGHDEEVVQLLKIIPKSR